MFNIDGTVNLEWRAGHFGMGNLFPLYSLVFVRYLCVDFTLLR